MPSPATSAATAAASVRQRVPRLAEVAVERARLTVVPRARTRAAKVPFVSLVTLLLVGGVVGLLLFNTSMQQSSFTATSLEQRATVLGAREEALALQLEELRDPQSVAAKAQEMGMRVPAAPLFLDLSDGSVAGDPAGAAATATVVLQAPPAPRPAELVAPTRVVAPPEGVLADGRGDRDRDRDRGGDGDRGQGRERARDRSDGRDQRGDRAEDARGSRNAGSNDRDAARDRRQDQRDQQDQQDRRERRQDRQGRSQR